MEKIKKIQIIGVVFLVIVNLFVFGFMQVYAHDAMLDIDYDDCIYSTGDGIDETWYVLDTGSLCHHLSQETNTIRYYFEEFSKDGNYSWTTDVSEEVANEIKVSFANSMKKWNDVLFYSYDDEGNVIKNKIINIVEGTASNHNLSIFPISDSSYIASTNTTGNAEIIETGGVVHRHYSQWEMHVNIEYFYEHEGRSESYVNAVRERNGAHEFGHILGLRDVDNYCNSDNLVDHHEEILMGYGFPIEERSQNITYKDIAGVAITRGIHTDDDHKWLNCGIQENGQNKLVCTICNGVKEVNNLNGYTYSTYYHCNGNHTLTSGNMFAVASFGTNDYYKCKYCRYIAPFSEIVAQNYILSQFTNDSYHKYENNVQGLNYTALEEHNHIYLYYNHASHRGTCSCGHTKIQAHYVKRTDIIDSRYARCLGCGRLLDLREDMAQVQSSDNIMFSRNGSCRLPNGIVILEDADIALYEDGLLEFYNISEIPQIM